MYVQCVYFIASVYIFIYTYIYMTVMYFVGSVISINTFHIRNGSLLSLTEYERLFPLQLLIFGGLCVMFVILALEFKKAAAQWVLL